MTADQPLEVPFHTTEFLALAAAEYANINAAFWRLRGVTGDDSPPAQREHLDRLRRGRREAYSALIAWAMQAESERLRGAQGGRE